MVVEGPGVVLKGPVVVLPVSLKTGAVAVRCTMFCPVTVDIGGDSDLALCDDV